MILKVLWPRVSFGLNRFLKLNEFLVVNYTDYGKHMGRLSLLGVLCLFLVPLTLQAETYKESRHLGTDQFFPLYGHATVVDCRSRMEYDVLHIKGAIHIPSGTMVGEDLERLLELYPHKPIVFYCNGSG